MAQELLENSSGIERVDEQDAVEALRSWESDDLEIPPRFVRWVEQGQQDVERQNSSRATIEFMIQEALVCREAGRNDLAREELEYAKNAVEYERGETRVELYGRIMEFIDEMGV